MSTKCIIGFVEKDKNIISSIVEHDGYVSGGVGEIIYNDFMSKDNASWLATLGDREYFNDTVNGDVHHFDSIGDFESFFLSVDSGIEFAYLFKNNKWFYRPKGDGSNDIDWEDLKHVFAKNKLEDY